MSGENAGQPRDLWILAGQSNMQGCGLLKGALPPDPRVWNFTMRGHWEIAEEPLHRLWESYTPIHAALLRSGDDPHTAAHTDEELAAEEAANRDWGAGLGLAFGKRLADATGRDVGLISTAHGGTSLGQWDWRLKDEGGASLYGSMLDRVQRARADRPQDVLRGILWYQGESDCIEGIAETYGERLAEWVAQLRADLDAPDLPFIAVQIGCVTRAPGDAPEEGWQTKPWEAVRQGLLEVPQRIPHSAVVATVDLGLTDTIHIDTPGLIRLGERMANAALQHERTGQMVLPHVVRVEKVEGPRVYGTARVICEGVTGGWQPRHHIFGFEVRTATGEVHPTIYVINANAADDPRHIDILLNVPADETVFIGYGLGCNPTCNATDEADYPLCAFAPLPVQ